MTFEAADQSIPLPVFAEMLAEKANKAPVQSTSPWRSWQAPAAVLLAASLTCYWPTAHAEFVFDDHYLVIDNPCITANDGLYRVWLTNKNYEYLPLTYSGFWLEHRLWGTNPLGYHLVSVVLHAINAFLLWLLLRQLSIPGAWLGAMLFAVHPVATSSVAWISEQKNLWGLLFALVSSLMYLRFEASGCRRWYVLSVICFMAALLGKTSVVMMPCLILAYEWRRAGTLRMKDVGRVAPFFLASLILGLVTVWFQVHRGIAGEHIPIGNFLERLVAAGYVARFYLGKALAPLNLSMIYPRWDYVQMTWLPGAALVGLFALLWRYRRGWEWSQACWLALGCYVLILTPVLGFVPMAFMRFSLVADHLQYPALPALTALVGAMTAWAISRHRAVVIAAGTAIATLIFLTMQQAGTYRDDETLWRETIRMNPEAWVAHINLGSALADRGQVDDAVAHFQKVLQIKPDSVDAHNNLGLALAGRGQIDEAIAHYQKAFQIKSNSVDAHNNLGLALAGRGQVDEAIAHYRKALQIKPDSAKTHNNLGEVLSAHGQVDEAIAHYLKALEINPDYVDAHNNLGNAFDSRGQVAEAISHYRKALQINPDNVDAHYNLGNALASGRQVDEAIAHYRKALEIKPDHVEAHTNLGVVLAHRGQFDDAIAHYRKALEVAPDYLLAHYNLGSALADCGLVDEALEHYRKALDLAMARHDGALGDRIRREIGSLEKK